jgi:hypothetical protein
MKTAERQLDETSCTARPDHTLGQNRKSSMRVYVFRCSPNNGHRSELGNDAARLRRRRLRGSSSKNKTPLNAA